MIDIKQIKKERYAFLLFCFICNSGISETGALVPQ